MRLFTGVPLPPDLRREVERRAAPWRSLAPDLKWVAPELLHVTLRFLGETEDSLLPELKSALQVLSTRRPFHLELGDPVGIPSGRRARVLAFALVDADRQLTKLAQALSRAIRPLGFPREQRAFRAHLTLARARRGETLPAALNPHRLASDGDALPAAKTLAPAADPGSGAAVILGTGRSFLPVEIFHLYESRLRPGGPLYRVLATVALKG